MREESVGANLKEKHDQKNFGTRRGVKPLAFYEIR